MEMILADMVFKYKIILQVIVLYTVLINKKFYEKVILSPFISLIQDKLAQKKLLNSDNEQNNKNT